VVAAAAALPIVNNTCWQPTSSPNLISDVNTPRTVRVEHSWTLRRQLYDDAGAAAAFALLVQAAAAAADKSMHKRVQVFNGVSWSVYCTHPAFLCILQQAWSIMVGAGHGRLLAAAVC
jgi:hypothetical protein